MNDFLQGPNNGQKNKRGTKTRRVFDSNHAYNSASKFHTGKYQGVRNGSMQRPGRQNFQSGMNEKASLLSAETIENIVSLVRTIAINQELLMDIQERRITAEERKADALENIAQSLSALSVNTDTREDEISMDKSFRNDDREDFIDNGFRDESSDFCSSMGQNPVHVNASKSNKFEKIADDRKKSKHSFTVDDQSLDSRLDGKPRSDGILSREEAMATIYRMREQGATFNQIANYFKEINQPTFSGKGQWHAQTIHRLLQKHKQSETA